MLSTSDLLGQMDLLEAIKIENLVQSKVDFDSPVLYYLNSYLLETPEHELLSDKSLNPERFPIHDRFIYNCILEHYGLVAKEERDLILSEVYAAMYLKEYENDLQKANELERLFHKMRKNNLEQESTDLLKQLYILHKEKPLEALYKHLYLKYSKVQEVNLKGVDHFISFNNKLSTVLEDKENEADYKPLILEYKKLRRLNEEFKNPNLAALLYLSKLILVSICGQDQLVKQCNKTAADLIEESKSNIALMAFGVERFYLQNILNQIEIYICADNGISNSIAGLKEKASTANNFGFPKTIVEKIQEKIKINKKNQKSKKINLRVDKKINLLVEKSISSLSIPRDSLLVRTNL